MQPWVTPTPPQSGLTLLMCLSYYQISFHVYTRVEGTVSLIISISDIKCDPEVIILHRVPHQQIITDLN